MHLAALLAGLLPVTVGGLLVAGAALPSAPAAQVGTVPARARAPVVGPARTPVAGAIPAGAVPAATVPAVTGPAANAPAAGRLRWGWPVKPRPAVLQRFRVGPQPWSPGHRGVDLAAASGQPVLAPADGVVRFAGTVVGRGVLVLDHAGGIRTSFEPVTDALPVGTAVSRGQPVARVGPAAGSHCAPTGCLHWGARRGESYLDPLSLLGLVPPIVLLPVR
jgi:murein DD-endopeptidase MepM/ murein hydrolase activator NlpD